jgi:hypothetical protein
MKKLAPIILFVYNRLDHTKKTIEALEKNRLAVESDLYIFSDAPKDKKGQNDVEKVRAYIGNVDGFKNVRIIKRDKNLGLAKSIISGVSEVIKKHGRVIVLEDDLVTAPNFLVYMNEALHVYKNDKRIYSVTGYNHPSSLMKIPSSYKHDVYLCPRAASWSWATWKDRWKDVDWDIKDFKEFKKNKRKQKEYNYSGDDKTNMLIAQMKGMLDSWAIRWDYHHFKKGAFCLYPVRSLIDNVGHDGTGVHCGKSDKYKNKLVENEINFVPNIVFNKEIVEEFRKIYKVNFISYVKMQIAKSPAYKIIKKIIK